MPDTTLLRTQPELTGPVLRLTQLDRTHLEDSLRALAEPEVRRMTHTHAEFTRPQVESYLGGLPGRADRADWAILRRADGRYLGEVALLDLDEPNESMNLRIALSGPESFGRGHGTEAVGLVLDFAFGPLGLHRVGLDLAAYNPRARRVYEKCGFRVEGVLQEAIRWDGAWHDSVLMSVLAGDRRLP